MMYIGSHPKQPHYRIKENRSNLLNTKLSLTNKNRDNPTKLTKFYQYTLIAQFLSGTMVYK